MWDWIMDHLRDRDLQKYLKFGAIPLTAVVLIGCILLFDRPPGEEATRGQETTALAESEAKSGDGQGESAGSESDSAGSEAESAGLEAGSEANSADGQTETTAAPLPDEKIQKLLSAPLMTDGVAEINTLMETYFQARIACDTQTLAKLFDSSSGWEEEAVLNRLVKQTGSVESYQNISCVTKEGLDEGSYVVFVKFDIKFYKTNTLAPSMLRCYVKQGEDGTYRIVETPDEAVSSYITQVQKTDEVIQLAKSVNLALETAVTEDGKLASIYNSLRTEIQ